MRVKNTQGQKQIHNVFLKALCLLGSLIFSIMGSLYYFVTGREIKSKFKPTIYSVFDFMFLLWPKYFSFRPSGYKITKFFGDFIHHIFLKK